MRFAGSLNIYIRSKIHVNKSQARNHLLNATPSSFCVCRIFEVQRNCVYNNAS